MPSMLLVLARRHLRLVDALHQHRQQDVAHEGRLARPRHPRDRDEAPERDVDGQVAQVVLACAVDRDLLEVRDAPFGRHRHRLLAGQVLPGDRLLDLFDALHRTGVHDGTAVLAGSGADVDDPVALTDRLLVVLDDDDGVAEIAQARERVDESPVVALVQTDRRLVEHVERADEPRADLAGEPDALRLTAGERAGGSRQTEVVEAHVEEEPEPGVGLLRDTLGDHLVALAQLERGEELRRLADRHLAHLGDVLAADGDRQA